MMKYDTREMVLRKFNFVLYQRNVASDIIYFQIESNFYYFEKYVY